MMKSNKGFIYKITSPTGKIYIGQTINIKERFSYYKKLKCIKQRKLFNSFKKYGYDLHTFEIIEECFCGENKTIINIKEQYWIQKFDSLKNGLNCNVGGGSNIGYKPTEETRQKMSALKKGNKNFLGKKHTEETKQKLKGRKVSEETIQKIRDSYKGKDHWNKGRKISENTRSKMSTSKIGNNNNLGKNHTEETKQKMRARVYSKETKQKMSQSNKNKIKVEIDKIEYESISKASLILNICEKTIKYRCVSDNLKFENYKLL